MFGGGIAFLDHDRRPVLEHIAGNLRRHNFPEIVVDSVDAGAEMGVEDAVGAVELAAGRAHVVVAFEIAGGLDFFHAVDARLQVGEGVFAVCIGLVEAMRVPEPSSK